MQDNFKELQSSDYKKYGLTKGAGVISSDPLKQARAVRENAAKQGRDIKIYQNELGEYGLEENGISLGLINKKGLSTQDFKNLGKEVVLDPTNLLMFTPIGAAAKGASLAAKIGSKAKRAATLAPAIAGGEVVRSSVANKAGGQDFIVDGDLSNAVLSGALGVGSIEALEGIAKGGKKLNNKAKRLLTKNDNTEKMLYSKGQLGDRASQAFEQASLQGAYGELPQKTMQRFLNEQDTALHTQINKLLKSSNIKDIEAPKELANNFLKLLREEKQAKEELVSDLFAKFDLEDVDIPELYIKRFIGDIEKATPNKAGKSVAAFGKNSYLKPVHDVTQQIKSYLSDNTTTAKFLDNIADVNPVKSSFDIKGAAKKLKNSDYGKKAVSQTLWDLEHNRGVINKAIGELVKKEDMQAVANMMKLKDTFDKAETNLINNLASKTKNNNLRQILNDLIDARAAKADLEKLFYNDKIVKDFGRGEKTALGIKDLLAAIDSDNADSENIIKLLTGASDEKKMQMLDRLNEIVTKKSKPKAKTLKDGKQVLEQTDLSLNPESIKNSIKDIYLHDLFKSINQKASGEDVRAITAHSNIVRELKKKGSFANSLFSKKEIDEILKIADVLEKVKKSYEPVNNSNTAIVSKLLQRIPIIPSLFNKYLGDVASDIKLRNSLYKADNGNVAKLLKAPVNLSKTQQATARTLANILANTKEVE